jgi:hypothetical protein
VQATSKTLGSAGVAQCDLNEGRGARSNKGAERRDLVTEPFLRQDDFPKPSGQTPVCLIVIDVDRRMPQQMLSAVCSP